MKFVSYLFFDGRCQEAFEFYAKLFGGTIVQMAKHSDTPASEHVGPEWQDKIINAHLQVGEQELMGSDQPPQYWKGQEGFSVSIHLDDEKEGKRIFDALADGGTVTLEYEPTFWAKRFAMLRDRFGIAWMINVPNAG
jgi:PhnB protein